MPSHNPNTAGLAGVVSGAGGVGDTPLGAVIMSIVMAGFAHRLFWRWWWLEAKNARRFLLWRSDVDLASALEAAGWPKSLSVATGGQLIGG